MPTQVTIIRHGETEWNIENRMQGQKNSSLTQNGFLQAELTAKALMTRKFHKILSSDLGRAMQTAEIINNKLRLPILQNSNLRERCFGVMEGQTGVESIQNIPHIYESYKRRMPDYKIPGGESLTEFYNRIITEFEIIAKQHDSKNVLVISHGCVLECLLYKIFDIDLSVNRNFSINNSSINTIAIDNNKWFLQEWGNIEHLIANNSN